MDHAIINCYEEEFAPFFAYTWRRAASWQPVLFYGRGPAGIGPLSGLILTAGGLWRFAREPQRLIDHQTKFIGQHVREISTCLGSYGMGGPGFLGLRFSNAWIVYRLWGADGWLTLNNELLEEALFPDERKPYDNLTSVSELKGAALRAIECCDEQYALTFTNNDHRLCLSVRRDGAAVPRWRSNGKLKVFAKDEQLEDALIISHTGRLWLTD